MRNCWPLRHILCEDILREEGEEERMYVKEEEREFIGGKSGGKGKEKGERIGLTHAIPNGREIDLLSVCGGSTLELV